MKTKKSILSLFAMTILLCSLFLSGCLIGGQEFESEDDFNTAIENSQKALSYENDFSISYSTKFESPDTEITKKFVMECSSNQIYFSGKVLTDMAGISDTAEFDFYYDGESCIAKGINGTYENVSTSITLLLSYYVEDLLETILLLDMPSYSEMTFSSGMYSATVDDLTYSIGFKDGFVAQINTVLNTINSDEETETTETEIKVNYSANVNIPSTSN